MNLTTAVSPLKPIAATQKRRPKYHISLKQHSVQRNNIIHTMTRAHMTQSIIIINELGML